VIFINLETVDVAQKSKHNIWQDAIKDFTMVMVSPEELASRDFNQQLKVKELWDCIFALGVDEVHPLSEEQNILQRQDICRANRGVHSRVFELILTRFCNQFQFQFHSVSRVDFDYLPNSGTCHS